MSGTGIVLADPNMYPADTCLGIWSRVDAEKMLGEPSDFASGRIARLFWKL